MQGGLSMKSTSEIEQIANQMVNYVVTKKYASLKRGEILDITSEIENILKEIIARIFYPDVFISNNIDNDFLAIKRLQLKSLLLRKVDFRDQIEILKDILLVMKPEIYENHKAIILKIRKELDKVRLLRNLLAHSELDLHIRTFSSNIDVKKSNWCYLEYKKGRVVRHVVDDEYIKKEINNMRVALSSLIELTELINNDITKVKEIEENSKQISK